MSSFRQGTELMTVQVVDFDPTTGSGVEGGTPYLFLIRTDTPSLYYYNGPLDTDWVLLTGGGGGGGGKASFTATADGAIFAGAPVYISGTGEVAMLIADGSIDPCVCMGLALTDYTDGATATIVQAGPIVLTTPQCIVLTNLPTLTAGDAYFVDDSTAGQLTATPPSATGDFSLIAASALDTLTLIVAVQPALGPL